MVLQKNWTFKYFYCNCLGTELGTSVVETVYFLYFSSVYLFCFFEDEFLFIYLDYSACIILVAKGYN